ncbi:MAG: hypothetical protein FWH27_12170 [Planctomycetaceae bacterium]|nr:hypothetical protein [Planctomycetaceae bacterium]
MRRRRTTSGSDTIESGQDSFLDIVSNMVGILIILVVVAGLRVRGLPLLSKADESKVTAAAEQFDRQQSAFESINRECLELTERFESMKTLHELREEESQRFLQYKAWLEHTIQSHIQTMDADSQTGFQLQRQLAEVDAMLEKLEHEKNWLNQQKPEAIVLENIPTPISSNADSEKEVHFRILNGRITHVPFRYLRTQLETEIMRRRNDLMTQSRVTGVLGPIDGFRMQYSVVRQDLPMHLAQEAGVRSVVMLERCEMVPVGDDKMLGETIEQALSPNSAFNTCLLGCRQNEYSVTVWVYPDSFGEFQKIKNYLYRSGYRTAARPMDFGQPITASPQGTRSANQ